MTAKVGSGTNNGESRRGAGHSDNQKPSSKIANNSGIDGVGYPSYRNPNELNPNLRSRRGGFDRSC